MSFGEDHSKKKIEIKNLKLKGGAIVWLRYSFTYCSFFIHSFSILIIGIHMPFGEDHSKKKIEIKNLKLKGGAIVWLRYSFTYCSFFIH